ncbi:nicotinate phosphoribosyltransferase [Novipirellula caenicola]|uniref:Nicotinate phosphoribosyltransferase n=1 Tax=Novipirellula caenicola TaxID=1536901 RepID=A0ABP9VQ11_9BACT
MGETFRGDGSLALLTDLYQLTMAYGYWKTQRHERNAVFHLFFRSHPFSGGYAIMAGLGPLMETLDEFRFTADDIAYLKTLRGNDHQPLFAEPFLRYLSELRLSCDIDAVPEGTVVFANEPLLRVQGSILQCQILETLLLNCINFPTLIATRAARVCQAAGDDTVLEFGLRRAQGNDGAMTASRAAYIGGCHATSNVLAGKCYDIPVKGTHAHSWVMSFDGEHEAFAAYASVMPNNCIFLVDTYDTVHGVANAILVAMELRKQGHEMIGVRLDSGDMVALSQRTRAMLDAAGLPDAKIVASNDLDEHQIQRLKRDGAKIDIWGVGTRLVTGYEQPALGGVYKLSAIVDSDGQWHDRVKLSEQSVKTSNPGIQQVRRYRNADQAVADVIYDIRDGTATSPRMVPIGSDEMHLFDEDEFEGDWQSEDLLVPVLRGGSRVGQWPTIHQIRQRTKKQLAMFSDDVRQLVEPAVYPTGLDVQLFETKRRLIATASPFHG